jgi:hypothetical protein
MLLRLMYRMYPRFGAPYSRKERLMCKLERHCAPTAAICESTAPATVRNFKRQPVTQLNPFRRLVDAPTIERCLSTPYL